VTIKYSFWNVHDGDERKPAFRAAVNEWKRDTCIVLQEQPDNSDVRPNIRVSNYDPDMCWLSGMGWPGNNGYSRINLGWCNSNRHRDSMIHEIGHAVGMNHEQKRPDAIRRYHSKGPYLVMHWENVPSEWTAQYISDEKSYIGWQMTVQMIPSPAMHHTILKASCTTPPKTDSTQSLLLKSNLSVDWAAYHQATLSKYSTCTNASGRGVHRHLTIVPSFAAKQICRTRTNGVTISTTTRYGACKATPKKGLLT